MNTNYARLSLVILALFANIITRGQIITDTLIKDYYDDFLQESELIEEITITNNSQEDYLTWISKFPITDKSNDILIYRFFFSSYGDFRLFDLMYENVVYEIKYIIPFNFIKKIPQGDSFTYIIKKENILSDFYDKRLVIISRNEVESCIKTAIREDFFYPWSSVCLTEKKELLQEDIDKDKSKMLEGYDSTTKRSCSRLFNKKIQ